MSDEKKISTTMELIPRSFRWPLSVLLEDLKTFFELLDVSNAQIEAYVSGCTKNNINNVNELRERASIQYLLHTIGISNEHVFHVMRKLFELDIESPVPFQSIPRRRPLLPATADSGSLLTRTNLVILNEIGHGASGRVYRALFVPTLKMVVVKYIEIKGPVEQRVAYHELKSLYAISFTSISGTEEPIAISTSPPLPMCPYISKFYGAFVDIDYGAVCLTLDFMNAGSLQNLLDEGRVLNLDEACVLSYAALQALSTLHKRSILHRDVKPSNFLVNTQGEIKLSDFGITKELMVARQADSFLGTVSFMNSDRVKGIKYSWEADYWGLGITVILAVTGIHPYDVTNGLWILMKNILESPQPELNESFDPDLRDFIHACLNATRNDSDAGEQLLQHPLFVAAKARGVISDDRIATLPNPPTHLLKACDTEAGEINQIVQVSLSWQLEYWGEEQGNLPMNGATMLRFPPEHIKALARQMNVHPELLEEKYRAKYEQIDRLCQCSWSLEGLRREMWGMPGEGKVANHVKLRAPRPSFTVDVERGESIIPPSSQPIVPVMLPADLGQYAVRSYSPPSHVAKTEGQKEDKEAQTEDKPVSTGSTTTEREEGSTAVPIVAAAKDAGKSNDDMPVANGSDGSGNGEYTK